MSINFCHVRPGQMKISSAGVESEPLTSQSDSTLDPLASSTSESLDALMIMATEQAVSLLGAQNAICSML